MGLWGRRRCQGSASYDAPTVGALGGAAVQCAILLLIYRGTLSEQSTSGPNCHWPLQGSWPGGLLARAGALCRKGTEMTELPKRELGRTGLQVTMLGYGAMELRGAPRG